jgi:hypothetical protein
VTAEFLTSNALVRLADEIASGASPDGLLRSRAAGLVEQIMGDAAASRFDAWGASTVLDENLGAPVIPRSLFEYLHKLAAIPAQWPIGNAGLVHVYGYLLSAVRTPHGLKKERWLGGQLATALGLPGDHFAPASRADSTLLQRVSAAVAPLLCSPGDATGLWFWADETGTHPAADGVTRTVFARTVVVRGAGSGDGALVYGVGVAGPGEPVTPSLVTVFPVAGLTSGWARAYSAKRPRLRFNAAASGVPPRTPLGDMRVRARP